MAMLLEPIQPYSGGPNRGGFRLNEILPPVTNETGELQEIGNEPVFPTDLTSKILPPGFNFGPAVEPPIPILTPEPQTAVGIPPLGTTWTTGATTPPLPNAVSLDTTPTTIGGTNIDSLLSLYDRLTARQANTIGSQPRSAENPSVAVFPTSSDSGSAMTGSGWLLLLAVLGIAVTIGAHYYFKKHSR